MVDHADEPTRTPHPAAATALLLVVLALFVGGGLFSGWLFLSNLRELIASGAVGSPVRVLDLESVQIAAPARKDVARPGAEATAVGPTPTPPPVADDPLPVWDGKDRVTILLLGIDQREGERDLPTRSDTMILVTLDPLNLTAGMLSIPRDLWVPIPGYQPNKINVAHFLGEMDRIGTGPDVARRTIRYNVGVPINYYARVDFKGFEQLIDAIGGITIDVDRAILDNEYPNETYGINRLFFPPGPQHMGGMQALRYARSRHADSDFGRIRRQQRVLQAARDQALTLGLIPKLPQMFGILRQSITTDIPFVDMLALANLGRRIKSDQIVSRQIDDTLIHDVNGDGSVLMPNRDKIRPVVAELFYDPSVRQEAARIELLNGTARDGLATTTRSALSDLGYGVVRVDSAARADYRETVILDNNGAKRGTVQRLAALLGVKPASIRSGDPAAPANITVILGADFRGVS